MGQIPTIGRIVHYTLSGGDAGEINRRREDASRNRASIAEAASGYVVHVGNSAQPGQVYPLVITRVWGDHEGAAVNGQLLLDGNDTFWVTSRTAGDSEGQFTWPVRT